MHQKYTAAEKNRCISIRCIWYIQSYIEFKNSHNSIRTVMIYHYETPPCGFLECTLRMVRLCHQLIILIC